LYRTFLLGLFLGVVGSAALTYFVSAVDLHRERSFIAVQPNGGNSETFYINMPHDRIFAGVREGDQVSNFPEQIQWPDDLGLDGSETEIFKLRNSENAVVGIACRISSGREASGSFIQWVMHLPARGTMFARMQLSTQQAGFRNGVLIAGTREFEVLNGSVREYFNSEAKSEEFDITGRLELVTALVGPLGEEE